MYAPVMDLRALMGVGPRITKHTITDVWMSPFPSYEDMDQGIEPARIPKRPVDARCRNPPEAGEEAG
jgi:hypothetical protein